MLDNIIRFAKKIPWQWHFEGEPIKYRIVVQKQFDDRYSFFPEEQIKGKWQPMKTGNFATQRECEEFIQNVTERTIQPAETFIYYIHEDAK
jgi:hypothetical protein